MSISKASPPRVRRIPGPERRTQLLDAGREIIRSDGVGSLTMSRLADAVGVTKPIVYKHFRNSEDVIIEILKRYAQGSIRAVNEHIRAAPTIYDFMDGVIDGLFEYIHLEGSIIRSITNGFSFSDNVNCEFLKMQDRSLRVYRHLLLQQGVSQQRASVAAYAITEMINSTIHEFAPNGTTNDVRILKDIVRGALGVLVNGPGLKPHVPADVLNPQE